MFRLQISSVPKTMHRLYNAIFFKKIYWFSFFMKSPQPIPFLYGFQCQQILSPVMIPRIPSKIVLDIRKCKGYFQRTFTVFECKNQFLIERKKGLGYQVMRKLKQLRGRKLIGKLYL